MNLLSEIADKLPEFQDYLEYNFEHRKTHFVERSQTKAVPLKMHVDELFYPKDCDNKDSMAVLEKVAAIGIESLKSELENENKATYK